MGLPVPDGVYSCELPNGVCITDSGEGRWLNLMPPNSLGRDAHKIIVKYNLDRGAYSLQFEKSKSYLTFDGVPSNNNKLLPGDKPRYFTITPHEYEKDKFVIGIKENKEDHLGMARELIYPPWVAMNNMQVAQAWHLASVYPTP
ncbi:hypothetical protein RhiJN_09705 [Ceratobasidium sp. AG-Ba]|nr:hypothetical protein RhiJN_09705 [Ceratobasidium sp. AG-Ba]